MATKNKTGKLTITEKYIIQGMLGEKKTIEEIATKLKRSIASIKKYCEGELNNTYNMIIQIEVDKLKDQVKNKEVEIQDVKQALVQANKPPAPPILTSQDLITQTLSADRDGNPRTVSVMTKPASEKSDAFREGMKESVSRTARNNLFKPKDGVMVNNKTKDGVEVIGDQKVYCIVPPDQKIYGWPAKNFPVQTDINGLRHVNNIAEGYSSKEIAEAAYKEMWQE